MTQRFNDMAAERDALYQATMPRGNFAEALKSEEIIASCLRRGWIAAASEASMWRDHNLLRLAIRGLTSRQEVTPGDN